MTITQDQMKYDRAIAARAVIQHLDALAMSLEPLVNSEHVAALKDVAAGMDVLASQHAQNALDYRARISVLFETISLLETVFEL